jgi:hypothetical protein
MGILVRVNSIKFGKISDFYSEIDASQLNFCPFWPLVSCKVEEKNSRGTSEIKKS